MSVVQTIGTEVAEAIKGKVWISGNILKDGKVDTLTLAIKLGLRFAKTIHRARKDGIASIDFAGSASSSALTLAALLCHTASKVLPYINCPQFVPMLVARAVSTSVLGDQMALYDVNGTTTIGSISESVFL